MKKENEPFIITMITDLAKVSSLVNSIFEDEAKTTKWLNTSNSSLGNQEPIEMIFAGQTEKLIKFIKNNEL